MSDLAAGIPIGLSMGIGAGIGIGKKSGQKKIAKKIRDLSVNHEIKVLKPDGKYMSVDEFIDKIGISTEPEANKKKLSILLIFGILVFVIGMIVFFLFR